MFHQHTTFHPATSSTAEGMDTFGGAIFQADDGLNAAQHNFSGSSTADAPGSEISQLTNSKQAVNEFIILSKNTRGLNDNRLDELHEELEQLESWDIVVLCETWRKPKQEFFKTQSGDVFANSGCEAGRRGVGFYIHKKWSSFIEEFAPLSERVAHLRIKIKQKTFIVIGVYFPHTGYPDHAVEEVYAAVSKLMVEGRKRKEHVIIAGDFNAEIGERNDFDDPRFIGKHSVGNTNPRGAWLKRFCCLNSITIANTLYTKPTEKITTYIGPNQRPRQIDFILIDQKTKRLLQDAASTQALDMGSDHRTVTMKLRLNVKLKIRERKQQVQWRQVCVETFKEHTELRMSQQPAMLTSDDMCRMVEDTLVKSATESTDIRRSEEGGSQNNELEDEIRNLIRSRRERDHASPERTVLSKKLQKAIRRRTREKRRDQIKAKLEEFKNIKHIPRLKTREKSRLITQMVDAHGDTQIKRMSIANIFATFYEELYSKQCAENSCDNTTRTNCDVVPIFTEHELVKALKTLKNGKCADTAGIRAEMLKNTGDRTRKVLLDVYNSILQGTLDTPTSWRKSVIKVLYKSGDPAEATNYRPICIIPILYKLFSKLLYFRLYPILDRAQCPDQAGFRHDYSTVDHVFVFKMLQEKSEEFQMNTWAAALDFKKAFDSIDQQYLWSTLREQQVPKTYIDILQDLYRNQTARVKTDKISREFTIERGTKQGDPLSSLLFNAVLENVMRRAKECFGTNKYGIKLGTTEGTRLNNLRFADDVVLVATSLNHLTQMLIEVQKEAANCGLGLHPEKTKIISSTNKNGRPGARHANVGTMKIEILPLQSSMKYLGCQISFGEMQEMELRQRIRGGWAKFMEHKQELTGRHYSLNSRLKLFDAVITPTVLYGSECWTTTKYMEDVLKTTQRKMLRMILGRGRRRIETQNHDEGTSGEDDDSNAVEEEIPETGDATNQEEELEPFVDWLRRVTHEAESRLERLQIKTWVESARTRKWRWAAKIFCTHSEDRWARIAYEWDPRIHRDAGRRMARRRAAGQRKRWFDDIERFLTDQQLSSMPRQMQSWHDLEERFAKSGTQ